MCRHIQRDASLSENLGWNQLGLARYNTARIDQLEAPAPIGRFAGDAVARDARLIADNGPPLAEDGIEQRRFADVGTADDDHRRKRHAILMITSSLASSSYVESA